MVLMKSDALSLFLGGVIICIEFQNMYEYCYRMYGMVQWFFG